jgi:hypothetical protein
MLEITTKTVRYFSSQFLFSIRDTFKLEDLISRKQFLAETLRQGLKVLFRRIDGNDMRSNCAPMDHSTDCDCISSDFSPNLLRMEAKRLGIDPEAIDSDDLLRAVYEVMKTQHSSTGNTNDASS